VDDDEDTRFLHRKLLSSAGYVTDEASDGEEAWKMILTIPYDLLLTDQDMPLLCGLDLVARIRAANLSLPVIIISGSNKLGEASQYPQLKLIAVVRKSVESCEVLEAVNLVMPLPPVEKGQNDCDVPAAATGKIPIKFALDSRSCADGELRHPSPRPHRLVIAKLSGEKEAG